MYSESELIQRIKDRFGDRFGDGFGDIPDGVGIGDDAALVNVPSGFSALLCSDLLVEDVHFRRRACPPDSVGFKALAVNVSDIGAMGGIPRYCLMSLAVPAEVGTRWIDGFLDGVAAACGEFEVRLAGGDTSSSERIFVDVAMMGVVETGRAVRRGGARAGDGIYVTGDLGSSAMGLAHLDAGGPADESARRHLYPRPRHRIGHGLSGQVRSMIDVSDGLSVDLSHVLTQSGVSARIERDRIPRSPGATIEQALHGGEDYELIMTGTGLPAEFESVPITKIGEIVAGPPGRILMAAGDQEQIVAPRGWRHFS